KKKKTYNSRYSLVVTHLTTNPPVPCLSTAERTGSSVFMVLWSYVLGRANFHQYIVHSPYVRSHSLDVLLFTTQVACHHHPSNLFCCSSLCHIVE
ncbi:hypothetical protein DM02DRAFT_538206, partial [Periconia macrospinosa]